jgi:hypothetical protein
MMTNKPSKLSELVTQWTLVLRAVSADPDSLAMAEVLPRYCESVNLYLRAVLKDQNAADDLCQEFAYRFARGDFKHVRPEKGRFRDYVKVSVRRMVWEHWRKAQHDAIHEPLKPEVVGVCFSDPDDEYDRALKTVLIDRSWAEMAKKCGNDQPSLYEVLRRKVESPERKSATLAVELTAEFGKSFTAVNVRQMIHRAREQFSIALREQVAALQSGSDVTAIDEELADLGLLAYCLPTSG